MTGYYSMNRKVYLTHTKYFFTSCGVYHYEAARAAMVISNVSNIYPFYIEGKEIPMYILFSMAQEFLNYIICKLRFPYIKIWHDYNVKQGGVSIVAPRVQRGKKYKIN